MIEILKMVCLIVWSLVGLTTIIATIWAIVFYKKIWTNMFIEKKEEIKED